MNIHRSIISLAVCLPLISSFAQVGSWENLPTLTAIRQVLPLNNQVFLATDGGVLSFSEQLSTFDPGVVGRESTNLDVNTLYLDTDSLLWIGARTPGAITEVVDLKSGQALPVEVVDLETITSFIQVGDSVYAAYQNGLEGGLLLYRKANEQIKYLDQFNNFSDEGNLDLSSIGDLVNLAGRLIFSAGNQLIWVNLDGSNLKDPTNWHLVSAPLGINQIIRLLPDGDQLLVAGNNQLYSYDFSSFTGLWTAPGTLVDLTRDPADPSRLVLASASTIWEYSLDTAEQQVLSTLSGINSIEMSDGDLWISSQSGFLSILRAGVLTDVSANRPLDHFFNRMIIDSEGQLVAAAQSGLSIHSKQGWRNISPGSKTSQFDASSYNWDQLIVDTLDYYGKAVAEDLIADHNGDLLVALQGKGVLKLDQRIPQASVFYNTEAGVLEPTFDSDTYILPGQMAVDPAGNVWLTTKFVRDGASTITILGVDGSVQHIKQYDGGLDSRTVKSIAIDQHGLVWIGSQVRTELQATGGIHLLDPHGSPGNAAVLDVARLGGSALGSNEILQLEIDSKNTLWILTPAGVQSMILPDKWLNSAQLESWASLYMTAKESDYYYYWQLTDYNVTGIEIDQRGNHWFLSSNAGVHVLLDNGRWINGGYGYNTGNSDLLDNEVQAAAFDAVSGRVYLATPNSRS